MAVTIVPPEQSDKAAWRRLFDGYAAFYRLPMTDRTAETTWRWIHDPNHVVEGLVARDEAGRVVGLAHFRAMPSPLRGADLGFLDDLFVDPQVRGRRVGEALIARVAEIGRRRGWQRIRWLTADDNDRARALYDRVARKSRWTVYELDP